MVNSAYSNIKQQLNLKNKWKYGVLKRNSKCTVNTYRIYENILYKPYIKKYILTYILFSYPYKSKLQTSGHFTPETLVHISKEQG